jgi:hypothetical protein
MEMQRENFKISYNGIEVIKHKWNSACREVERLIGEIAQEQGKTFRLVKQHSEKEGFGHVVGIRVWQSDDSIVLFTIEKVQS